MRNLLQGSVLVTLLAFCLTAQAQTGEHVNRGAVSAGAGLMAAGDSRVSALLGQSVTGSASAGGEYMRLGFYAQARWLPTQVRSGTAGAPARFFLAQNYPNPFNAVTVIDYTVTQTGPVRLKIFDVLGREVATCVDAVLTAGSHRFLFEAGHLPTGVYYYVLESGAAVAKRRGLLIR